ncbi:MAG: phosphatase PAP2 family protein [Gammaproteobacteria bacterium]|nr:phosphatase PAP2 family protein [Gammaproteobacteria bacterium]MBU1724181.1 phosphatase PAP2 family protein [Gammaproteobacteria bacterium]MBU2006722.1 phosphatase PAP2 family protein [Gammaproteobacteria bacterium]
MALRLHFDFAQYRRAATDDSFLDSVGVPAMLLALLAATVGMGGLNTGLFWDMNSVFRLLPDAVWANITILGDALVSLALLSLLAFRFPQLLPAGLLAGLIATLLTRSLKPLLAMERPLAALGEQVHVIGIDLQNFSFPSGHTTAAFVLAGVYALVLQRERLTVLLFMAAALVGLSRMAVGAHWLTDVLAGGAFGWFSAWAGWSLAQRWQWANSLSGRRVMSALYLLFAILLFWLDSGYPQAFPLQMGIATLATAACLTTLWKTWRNPT